MSGPTSALQTHPIAQPTSQSVRVRPSLFTLQEAYLNGTNQKPLEDLWRAFIGIQNKNPDDIQSFFNLGGYHGEPFRGKGATNAQWWGGYCAHGNVLFPLWHRAYVLFMERALQSIPGCQDVMLPFWDETSPESLKNGIPWALTVEYILLDGKPVKNPLKSFTFPIALQDQSGDNPSYSKYQGYTTVRYPQSGMVSTPEQQAATKAHNEQYGDDGLNTALLNQNVMYWLDSPEIKVDNEVVWTSIAKQFSDCLNAPTYTVFSNTTSAAQYNRENTDPNDPSKHTKPVVVPLETPHNAIHLAVGGFDFPGPGSDFDPTVPGANGDMGENNTAGLDPIFFFHHCNIDRMFWVWQKKHNATKILDIVAGYPGTTDDYKITGQGPPAGYPDDPVALNLKSPLLPFKKDESTYFTALDVVDSLALGVDYAIGSLDDTAPSKVTLMSAPPPNLTPVSQTLMSAPPLNLTPVSRVITVSGVNRAQIIGSFIIAIYAYLDGKQKLIHFEPVLSRWNVEGCANCQNHLETSATVALPTAKNVFVNGVHPVPIVPDPNHIQVDVKIITRHGVIAHGRPLPIPYSKIVQPTFKVDVKTMKNDASGV